jgi:hypothetical protein
MNLPAKRGNADHKARFQVYLVVLVEAAQTIANMKNTGLSNSKEA